MKGNFVGLLLIWQVTVYAQEYLWPTDASPYMTSAFGESRPRRFHAAIDIKTWNQVGYKTFAVRSGYIERMAISPFGYGRVLYLRLDTGEIAVYAHLEKFNEKLQALAEQEQERAGRYRIDKYFSPGVLPVQKGEVIGYTGQSGIGTPHLHFELRDSRNRPFNPFLRGFKVADAIPPVISDFAVSPLTPGAMVNGDFLPVVLRPFRQNGTWRLAESIQIAGKVGVAVDAHDKADGAENRFAIYRMQLFVDDSLQFQTQYDRFDYSQNKLIELDRDYFLKRRGLGNFHRLYRIAGNALGFYSHLNHADGALISRPDEAGGSGGPNYGIDERVRESRHYQPLSGLSWGAHRLRVVVSDFFGNHAVLEADVLVGPAFTIVPQIVDHQPTRLHISSIQAPPTRKIQKLEAAAATVNGRTIISPWRPITAKWKTLTPKQAGFLSQATGTDSLPNGSSTVEKQLYSVSKDSVLELPTAGAHLIRLVAVDQHGLRSHPAYILNPPDRTLATPLLINVEKDFSPNFLRLLIRANQPLGGAPSIKFSSGGKIFQVSGIPQQPHRYVASVPLAEIAGDSVQLEVAAETMFGHQEVWREWFVNAVVQPGRGRSLFAADARMRVAFSEESVYWPLYGRVHIDTVTRLNDPRVIGPIYRVEPQDVALSEGATVTLSYPDTISQPRQIGVCYRDRNAWVFIDNKVNPANRTVSARIFSLEDFAIMRDSEPPALNIRSPHPGAVIRDRRPLIVVEVKDSTSGFESEQAIELRLDGQLLIAEYDPERDIVQYKPKRELSPGIHKLAVRAEDRCGNVARQETEFTVR
ncbi:MAG: hypothetical protein ONB46_22110 [candidate division KSB1 bacterium]|nr:hypothetical protein [candidate division KSB1 bacterium]MDZ7367739.1 hypothetical protein [candidate division KSB1 bacterium]MDZ7406295.1 hypothetical protein [candidate division KSB1 bacterium]